MRRVLSSSHSSDGVGRYPEQLGDGMLSLEVAMQPLDFSNLLCGQFRLPVAVHAVAGTFVHGVVVRLTIPRNISPGLTILVLALL